MKVSNLTETNPDSKEDPAKIKKRVQRLKEGFLTDKDIKRIRKKLGLAQREMAKELGVGEKNFARYENLSVRQSKAMDNLLRILDAYPDAIKLLGVNKQSNRFKNE
jgi:HTH-type transcriptional regulator/antitoxin MqsA